MKHQSILFRLLSSHLLIVGLTALTLYLASTVIAPWLHSAGFFAVLGDVFIACQETVRRTLLWGLGAAILIACLVSWIIARHMVKPLKRMQCVSEFIAQGNYNKRLEENGPDEINKLAKSFNIMAKSLEQTEKQRVELIGTVAHELSTPLSSLKGFIEGMEDGHFTATENTFRACKRQLERLEHLVDDLALLSQAEAETIKLNLTEINAVTLLEQAALAFDPQRCQAKVNLLLDYPEAKPHILADGERLAQVLANLINNAIRHTPKEGTITLSLSTISKKMLRFAVSDTGEGIPNEALPHLFTRFFRVDSARKSRGDSGSGIGLTIAKYYVEAHGGSIGVESELGVGSCFWFSLPKMRSLH